MAVRLPQLGPRARKALRIVGYVVLALVTFVFALQWTFPFHRVRDKIVEVLSAKYEVQIGSVERGIIPGRVFFNQVQLRTRVTKADEVPSLLYIQRLEVDVGLLALLGGKASVDIDAKIGPGHIEGTIALSKGATEIHLDGANLPSESLPMREALGLPMKGKINFSVDLDLPNQRLKSGRAGPNWQQAEGAIAFACRTGCTFGDGKTKLKPKLKNTRNQAFAADGIEFGTINVTSMLAKIDIKKGKLAVKQFDTKSEDGELHVDYAMDLAQTFDESMVTGCLRFNGSQALLAREPKTFAAISTTGAPLGPDNLYHIRLTGKFKEMKRLGQPCGAAVSGVDIDAPPARPNLTIQADSPLSPDAGAPAVNPPPTPVTPPADAAVAVPVPGPEGEGSGSAGSANGSANGSAHTGSAEPPPPGVPAAGEPRPEPTPVPEDGR